MMKKFFIFQIFFTLYTLAYSQCTLLPNALPGLTLTHQNPNCFNNSGVAYNPNFNLYYAVRAGNPTFPLETWTAAGVPLYNTTAGFDWRGMWWNPATNQLEGNGYNTSGIWKADLNGSGYALNTGANIFMGMNQPDPQSCGDLDWQAYEILYYFNGFIYRYSRTTNAFLGSYPITGTPVPIADLNTTTLMYTGCTGMEIALLDYVNKRIYVYNKANGAYAGMSQLPMGAVTTGSFRTSWSNCFVWLFNLSNITWYSYQIFTSCSSCTPVYTNQNLSICHGDSILLGGAWQHVNGTYHDTLTAVNGCDSIITSNLTVLSTVSVSPNATICSGASTTLTASGATTYLWSPAMGLNTTTGTTVIANPAVTTTYTVVGTLNACTSSASVQVTVNPLPIPTSGNNGPICEGSNLNLTSGGGASYSWSGPNSFTSSTQNPTITAATIAASGTYTVTVTSAQGCSATAQTIVTINPNITPTFTAVAPICAGAVLAPLPTTSVNGYTGTWSPAMNNMTTTTYTFTPTAGQCAVSTTMTITVNPNITPTFTAVGPICSGAILNALPATSNNGYTGTWSPALNNTATTTYTFTPTAGQCAVTTTLTITVNSVYSQNVSAVICNGNIYTFPDGTTSTTATTHTSTLSSISGCDSIIITTLAVNPSYSINNPQTICNGQVYTFNTHNYTVTGTYYDTLFTLARCDSIIVTQLTVNSLPVVTINPAQPSICIGSTISLVANGAATYLWNNSLGTSNTITILPVTTTTYTVTGTTSGCTGSASITVNVYPYPTVNILATVNPICEGSSTTLTANGAVNYSWSNALNTNPIIVTPATTTHYSVTGTSNGCTGTADIVVSVSTMPVVKSWQQFNSLSRHSDYS